MGNFPVTESRVTGWGNLAELLRVSYVDPQVENIQVWANIHSNQCKRINNMKKKNIKV